MYIGGTSNIYCGYDLQSGWWIRGIRLATMAVSKVTQTMEREKSCRQRRPLQRPMEEGNGKMQDTERLVWLECRKHQKKAAEVSWDQT